MRITIFGNLFNLGARLARFLRSRAEVTGIAPYPPFYEEGEADHIVNRGDRASPDRPGSLSDLVREYALLSRADLIVSLTALLSGRQFFYPFVRCKLRPYVAYSTGSDLRDLSRERGSAGRRAREYFKGARLTVVTNFDEFTLDAIKSLGLQRVHYYRFPMPPESDAAPLTAEETRLIARVADFTGRHPFNLYLPATIHFARAKTDPSYRMSKGNDVAYRALIELAERHEFGVIVRDHGPDAAEGKAILEPIKDRVLFVPTVGRGALRRIAERCDAVLDQFAIGTFGATALEMGLLGVPVVTRLNEEMKAFYSALPPYLNAKTEAGVVDQVERLMAMGADERRRLGGDISAWVRREHGPAAAEELVERILACVPA